MSPILGGRQGPVRPAQGLLVGLKENAPPGPAPGAKMQSTPLEIPAPQNAAPGPHFPQHSPCKDMDSQCGLTTALGGRQVERTFCFPEKEMETQRASELSRVPQCISEGEGAKTRPSFQSGGRAQWLENRLWCHPPILPCAIY